MIDKLWKDAEKREEVMFYKVASLNKTVFGRKKTLKIDVLKEVRI